MVVGYILGGGYCQFDDTFNLISVYHTSKCCSKKKRINKATGRALTPKRTTIAKQKTKKQSICVFERI